MNHLKQTASNREPRIAAERRPDARETAAQRLTQEQEHELARRMRDGDTEARNELVERNLGLVRAIAREFCRAVASRDCADELISEGSFALIRAAERFDPERGVRFSSYAALWVRHAVQDAFYSMRRPVRLSARASSEMLAVARVSEALRTELSREPSVTELAERAGLTRRRVRELRGGTGLMSVAAGNTGEEPIIETMPGAGDRAAIEAVDNSDIMRLVHDELRALPAAERDAVSRLVGRDSGRQTRRRGVPRISPGHDRTLTLALNHLRDGLRRHVAADTLSPA